MSLIVMFCIDANKSKVEDINDGDSLLKIDLNASASEQAPNDIEVENIDDEELGIIAFFILRCIILVI
jgi:hypothetical protein